MFLREFRKASLIIMVSFFALPFNFKIYSQVKYVYHNKANLKLNRKHSIPRVASKSLQIVKSNIVKSNSTKRIKLSAVEIITNTGYKDNLSSIIIQQNESPSKVDVTNISGVEIILGSDNYLAKNSLKSEKTQNIIKYKATNLSNLTRFKSKEQGNDLDNENLFEDSSSKKTTVYDLIEINKGKILEEPNKKIEETIIEETIPEEVISETEKVESSTEDSITQEILLEEPIVEEGLGNTAEAIEELQEVIVSEIEEFEPSTEDLITQEILLEEPIVEEGLENTAEAIKEELNEKIITESMEEFEPASKNSLNQETTAKNPEEFFKETKGEKSIEEPISEETKVTYNKTTIDKPKNTYKLSLSAKHENELANKAVLYYTVRVKSVSNPTDGLKFLMEIKDNDAVWDEHTFHLFKDKENENITNISIGKFVDKENAKELMAYLKTKNITNPSIEIHENNVKNTVNNLEPISKPINTTNPRTGIENTVNKVVKSNEAKKEVSSNKILLDNISSKVDESENYFSVQVGANNKISSTNIQGLNLNKEKLFFVNIEKGKYAMNYGKHEDYGSAHKIALEIHKKGLETAFVTKYENGVRVKISKKDYLTDKTSKKTISDDINQLGYIPIGPNDKGKFVQIGTIYNWDAHNFKSLYDQLERTIYYKIKENNSVIFLVGPLQENEVFIELRNIKQVISDAFIKTI